MTDDAAVAALATTLHESSCMEYDGFCPGGLDRAVAERMLPMLRADPAAARAVAAALLTEEGLGAVLHETGECENWEPGYRYMAGGKVRLDVEGDTAAHQRSAGRILAALRSPQP